MNIQDQITELQSIQPSARGADWGFKLQQVVRQFWRLMNDDPNQAKPLLAAIVKILSDPTAYLIASMILPQLRARQSELSSVPVLLQEFLDKLQTTRQEVMEFHSYDQKNKDHVFYQSEKEVLMDAELHRACSLLLGKSNVGKEGEEKVHEWINSRPTM